MFEQKDMNRYNRILTIILLAVTAWATAAQAATDYRVRYVNGKEGAYANDGLSWETAKSNLQNAIDDLYEEIRQQADAVGYVFVAGAEGEGQKYVPTRRATDDADGSSFNTSFRIYERIYVFGGFKGDETINDGEGVETLPYKRIMTNDRTLGADEQLIEQDDIEHAVRRWNLKYKTILSGNHSVIASTFTYDTSRGRYTTSFPLNSYHVVWFGTNGTIDDATHPGHYKGLAREACVDGFTICEGNASSTVTSGHDHTGFGGGVYMVRNALLRNCIVERCSASLRGGGVYLDGGGTVERCYVHTCQSAGVGVVQGYGGAVCIDYDGSVQHSYILQSAARIGAGVAICRANGDAYDYPEASALSQDATLTAAASQYSPFCVATVIANCTAAAEAGGAYLDQGGTLNHCTVVRNTCIGPDVVYYGRRHGRTGGIYVRTRGTIYNTTAWGNTSPVNNDVQFASFKEGSAKATDVISVYHSAFSQHDITDWSSATKQAVVSLASANTPELGSATGNFPVFRQPSLQWGASESAAGIQYDENGNVDPTATEPGQPYQHVYNWHPLSTSALRLKSVQVTDAIQGISSSVLHAHTDVDVVGRRFEAISSCGALAHTTRTFQHALVASLESGESDLIPTIFVDPQRKVVGQQNGEESTGWDDNAEGNEVGMSWAKPASNVPDAIVYFKQHLVEGGDEASTYYDFDGTHYQHVQILVKEGSINTAGTGSYLGTQARTAALRPVSNMRLYGSFPTDNADTDTSGRNQRQTATRVSANVLNSTYMNNGAHVFAIINQHNVIIDGFRLYSGNANLGNDHTYSTEDVRYGGGLIVNNTSRPQAERIDMRGNLIRNCVFSNCSAPEGAAIYVNGNNPKADGTLTRAELTVVNCIMRNSTAGDMQGDNHYFETHQTDGAVVCARGNAHLWLRNCDIVNNCGYALKATESPNYSGYSYSPNATGNCPDYPDRYQIEIYNSILFSNGLQITPDRTDIGQPVSCAWSPSIIGNYIYLDYDAEKPNGMPADLKCFNILTRSKKDDRQPNPNYVEGTSPDYLKTLSYPYFTNPSRNVGHSEDNDKPLYGGVVSYEPLNMNPIVNGANPDTGSSDWLTVGGEDTYRVNSLAMSYDAAWKDRSYGGAPDAGAVEDVKLPEAGTVIYVTPDGAGRRDGSSWSNAIAGNTVYLLDDVPGPGLATGDQIDAEPTCDRILDADGNPVLTTDEKYCGGFGRVWFTDKKTGGTSTTTVTKTWITETNVYSGGERDGETETLQDGSTPTVTTESTINSQGSTVSGFTAGYAYDPRFPYGEISGASRSFWRANPYHEGTDWNNAAAYNDLAAFIAACNENGWINNNRQERYVSGLQYAVERAAAYNALPEDDANRIDGIDAVQVWVGNGKYTDYKGFVMRDKTTVLGSFPAREGVTPGLKERQALMSAVMEIPKSMPAQDLEPEDYETILQISDTDPKQDNETLNSEAVKYWDDDLSETIVEDSQTTIDEDVSIINYYRWADHEEQTTTYMRYPDMLYAAPNTNVFAQRHKTDKTAPNGGITVGGVTWSSGEKYVYQYFGNQGGGNNSWELIYANRSNNVDYNSFRFDGNRNVVDDNGNVIDVVPRGMELSGGMIGMSVWQTMKNVPAGHYKIQADLAAFYRATGGGHDTGDEDTGITFYVINSSGNICASQTIYCANPSTPYKLKRYTFDAVQETAGDFTVRIMAAPGTKATDPQTGSLPALNNNPNRREVLMANLHIINMFEEPSYVLDNSNTNRTVTSTSSPSLSTKTNYTPQNHRTTLRKRVLTMPDVTVPTYGGGRVGDPLVKDNKFGDDLCHTDRVKKNSRTSTTRTKEEDSHYVEYSDVEWDGFTIRHGFLSDEIMAHGGGAGVNMYEGARLKNCIIVNNMTYCGRVKGCGIFCDGSNSSVEGCFVLDNTAAMRNTASYSQNQIFAGGMFMYEGTCFNSLFAKNYSNGSAGGVGFCVGRFYNNTIVYNTCQLKENNNYMGGAISLATASNPNLFIANTIIYGNNGIAIRDRNTDVNNVNPFIHCYIQSEIAQPYNATLKNVNNWSESNTGNYGVGNTFLNGVPATAENSPFDADLLGIGTASLHNDFRLSGEKAICVNMGTEDFTGNLFTALRHKGRNETQINSSFLYQSVAAAVLPDNDVAYADRVQDCEIDIGAYEYDGTKDIEPDLSEDGKAIFYVSQNGGGGLATASTPEDAACAVKLQKVLDAAGRWKYAASYYGNTDDTAFDPADNPDYKYNWTSFDEELLTEELTLAAVKNGDIAEGESLAPDVLQERLAALKDRTVIIKLAGDYTDTKTGFAYAPTRTTVTNPEQEVNLLEYSFIVPRGVQLWGGYTEKEVQKRDADGNVISDETWPAFSDQSRDVLAYPTRLSGVVINEETGTAGNVFRVVTFTENLFTTKEKLIGYGNDQIQLTGQLHDYADDTDSPNREGNRAVLDGLFIQDGHASGNDESSRRGAGAVVTGYAHIRNCIVENNEAAEQGGGLYLEPCALVSGTIVKGNTAQTGGGIYVEEPTAEDGSSITTDNSTFAHIYTTTVVGNYASTTAGGLWFATNLRASSSAFWKNTANDLNNVAGSFTTATNITGEDPTAARYPFVYCGVESQRISGVNNILLPTDEDQGVRWSHTDWWELERWSRYHSGSATRSDSLYYYPITMSSVLARGGMTYAAWENARAVYPTLETADMAGLQRMEQTEADWLQVSGVQRVAKDNAFIEMGARVLNKTFEVVVDPKCIMTRLFVTTTEVLPSAEAYALQENTNDDDDSRMYRQMGSCYANPFHRLGDAFEYIMKVRRGTDPVHDQITVDGVTTTMGEYYRDKRFEVIVSRGTFYPFRNAYGQQGEARTNTFVIPEGVTVVGGVDNDKTKQHWYCQAGYGQPTGTVADVNVATSSGSTIHLNGATTQFIRDDRLRQDRNGNSVQEPWEMYHQTVLSGNAVNMDDKTNVYHVITCYSDEEQVGLLPHRYDSNGSELSELDPEVTYTQPQMLENLHQESIESKDSRTIILDGLMIQEAHANFIGDRDIEADGEEPTGIQKATQLTYFRGGGILVDGNWNHTFTENGTMAEVLGVAKRDIPLMVVNCQFQNNMAGNGGAIYTNGTLYAMGSRFTQNYSCGPTSVNDQRFIPWTAGGAIATNYECSLWNCLFDNNEARRGQDEGVDYPISSELTNRLMSEYGVNYTNSDACQGSGGVVSASATSVVRVLNCDMVKNKAVQYPAIYNHIDNGVRTADAAAIAQYGPGRHYAVNTIFWGNEATGSQVVMLDGSSAGTHRQPNHVANFGEEDDEMLYFCAYEEGTAVEATTPQPVITDGMSPDDIAAAVAEAQRLRDEAKMSHLISTNTSVYQDDDIDVIKYGYLDKAQVFGTNPATGKPYNHNQIVSSSNSASDGPNFVLPTAIAGTDGYMENADWLVTRLNALIDNGWSYLQQEVRKKSETSTTLLTNYLDADGQRLDEAGNDDELGGAGFYNVFSKSFYGRFGDYGFHDLLPIGNEKYMEYHRTGRTTLENMKRISTYPRIGEERVFIDIGVYEYQYVQLSALGDEIDVIWVGPETGLGNNGSTAQQCTSDLQGAIETLLLSRNGHDKMVKLKEGTYSPLRLTTNNKQTFFINVPTRSDGVTMPGGYGDDHLGIKSLTIRGGYSLMPLDDANDGEADRDVEQHPTVIAMKRYSNNTDDQLDHLFIVENAEQTLSYGNFLSTGTGETAAPEFTGRAVPIVFDGLTFTNPYAQNKDEKGGAALLYDEQYRSTSDGLSKTNRLLQKPVDLTNLGAPEVGGADYHKLIIRDCIFKGNGAEGAGISAVKVGEGGGQTLVVNTLFHSNNGDPLDAVNTQVVNSTFALNEGHLRLADVTEEYKGEDGVTVVSSESFPSQLHNSIIWKDDQAASLATQFSVPTTLFSGTVSTARMTYNAITGYANTDETADNHNIQLDDVNNDVMKGPNFAAPQETFADESTADERQEQRMARDFHINPSARIINRGNTAKYQELVPYYPTFPQYQSNPEVVAPDDDVTVSTRYAHYRNVYEDDDHSQLLSQYWFHTVQRSPRLSATQFSEAILKGSDATNHVEPELSGVPRLKGSRVERGAYESTAAVERVLYVSIDGSDGNDGTSWEKAFSLDQLQTAIDVASIYSMTSGTTPLERAYVFVKGAESAANGGKPINIRDGVSVFGGLRMGFGSEAIRDRELDTETNQYTMYSDQEVARYVRQVQAGRDGVAAKGANSSTIVGLRSDNTATPEVGFQLDGFWLNAGTADATPFVADKALTVLNNNVITGNTVSADGQPVVDMQQGLLYNSLFFSNTAGSGAPLVSIGSNAYMLNCTVVGEEEQTLIGGSGNPGHVKNTISVGEPTSARAPMFAPYQRPESRGGNTAYSLADAPTLTTWQPYWYQLHEQSTQIDTGEETAAVNAWLPAGLRPFVDFGHDRDALGNPRRLSAGVDNGCFETWRVSGDRYATNQTNIAATGESGFYQSYTDDYGGHRYPHEGSVVYLTEGSNLVLRMTGTGVLRPGYLLAQAGSSLYGQGYHVQLPYVAAERRLSPASPALTALPFDYGLQHAYSVSYDSSNGSISQVPERTNFDAQQYDGEQRSHWRYHFHENESECWGDALAADATIEACDGWLTTYNGSDDQAVRFTAWSGDGYVYEEDGTAKTVTLTQYDDRSSTAGGADFTKLENMGWNLKGLPWLVSNYQTSPLADGTYQMQVPHVIYSTLDGTANTRYGQFYTAQSWSDGATLSQGNAFFTQTAAIGPEETVVFKLPVFNGTTVAAARQQVGIYALGDATRSDGAAATDWQSGVFDDVVDVWPQADADTAMPFRQGNDGIKWMAFNHNLPQLYVTTADGTRLSMATQAPVETEIPLGLYLPRGGSYVIALPTPEAYADQDAVWLIDHEAGTVTNLLSSDYTLTASAGGDITTRLTLIFGGSQPGISEKDTNDRSYRIGVRQDIIYILGTRAGDDLSIHTVGGALVMRGKATGSSHEQHVAPGVYVVTVNGYSKKVLAK